MNKRLVPYLLVNGLFFLVLFTSCSDYQKVLKSTDMDYKYQMAKKYYAEKEYYRAQPLFDELINFYKGTKNVEDVYYYDAYSYFGEGEYIMAQYNFKNFVTTYPTSP